MLRFIFLLLGAIVALLLIAVIKTVLIKNREQPVTPPAVDKEKADNYAENLSAMIKHETVWEETGDKVATEKIFGEFRELLEKIYPKIHEICEKKLIDGALLFKWMGKDPTRDSIILMAHHDVVPATGDWTYPAFSGTIAEEKIWGRGTADNKGSLCAVLEAVEGLIGEGFTPPQDIYISSSNNEETMGKGALIIKDYLDEQGIKLAVAIDEGGAVVEKPLPGLAGSYAMLGVLEKGYANVKFTARSKGGHSSTPGANTPLVTLARFIKEVEEKPPFPKKFTPPVKEMFGQLAPYMSFPFRLLLGNIWLFSPLLKLVLPMVSGQAAALLKTTCAFTMAEGSSAPNVIPETASVTANLRFMIHQPMKESLSAIEGVAKKYGLEMDVLYSNDCSPMVDINSKDYQFIMGAVKEIFPEVGVAPYVMLGATDSRHFAKDCPCTVRFAPTILSPTQLNRIHGIDETLGVDALARAVSFYDYVIRNYQ